MFDEIKWKPETELCALALKHGTDKWGWHCYTPHYDRLLKDRRNTVKKVLEFGIGTPESMARPDGKPYKPGASLRMWEEYFPNAEIYALDNVESILINDGRIRSFWCDQSSEDSLKKVSLFPELKSCELIIDDGSHTPEHQKMTANIFFPLLAPNGIYIIEDVWIHPSEVSWSKEPFGLKVSDLSYKSEVIAADGEGNNGGHLVIMKGNA